MASPERGANPELERVARERERKIEGRATTLRKKFDAGEITEMYGMSVGEFFASKKASPGNPELDALIVKWAREQAIHDFRVDEVKRDIAQRLASGLAGVPEENAITTVDGVLVADFFRHPKFEPGTPWKHKKLKLQWIKERAEAQIQEEDALKAMGAEPIEGQRAVADIRFDPAVLLVKLKPDAKERELWAKIQGQEKQVRAARQSLKVLLDAFDTQMKSLKDAGVNVQEAHAVAEARNTANPFSVEQLQESFDKQKKALEAAVKGDAAALDKLKEILKLREEQVKTIQKQIPVVRQDLRRLEAKAKEHALTIARNTARGGPTPEDIAKGIEQQKESQRLRTRELERNKIRQEWQARGRRDKDTSLATPPSQKGIYAWALRFANWWTGKGGKGSHEHPHEEHGGHEEAPAQPKTLEDLKLVFAHGVASLRVQAARQAYAYFGWRSTLYKEIFQYGDEELQEKIAHQFLLRKDIYEENPVLDEEGNPTGDRKRKMKVPPLENLMLVIEHGDGRLQDEAWEQLRVQGLRDAIFKESSLLARTQILDSLFQKNRGRESWSPQYEQTLSRIVVRNISSLDHGDWQHIREITPLHGQPIDLSFLKRLMFRGPEQLRERVWNYYQRADLTCKDLAEVVVHGSKRLRNAAWEKVVQRPDTTLKDIENITKIAWAEQEFQHKVEEYKGKLGAREKLRNS